MHGKSFGVDAGAGARGFSRGGARGFRPCCGVCERKAGVLMAATFLLSILAGVLSVLSPCVLPLLPVIVGGSLVHRSRVRPYIIAAALTASLLLFTLLLKVSSALAGIDPVVWSIISGGLIILLGVSMLAPGVWEAVARRLHLTSLSQRMLTSATERRSALASAVLTGAALGPVFSSCSPTYSWVLASVIPVNLAEGLLYLAAYCVSLSAALLLLSIIGRRLIDRVKWAANPRGWFQRSVALLFILVGVFVATGWDKQVQAWTLEHMPTVQKIEEGALSVQENTNTSKDESTLLNASYDAPELAGIEDWINSDAITLKQLRGKVVLIDFWTYSCINCLRTQPYLNAWYERYKHDGFEIIGVHAPEFSFEKVTANVRQHVESANITYPVALDNSFRTWFAYKNHYWPAKYLIDRNGKVRYTHFGEGEYEQTEEAIRTLLQASGPLTSVEATGEKTVPFQSPETYLGTARAENFVGTPQLADGLTVYTPDTNLARNSWTLGGSWGVDAESITSVEDGASLSYRFNGAEMYLVMGGREGARVRVEVEGQPHAGGVDVGADGAVTIAGDRLYRLVKLPQPALGTTVKLTFDKGVTANAFTFGG